MAEHGTRQCYADGCRLPECRAAQAQYRREHKARQLGVVTDFPKAGRKPKTAAEQSVAVAVQAVPASRGEVGRNEQATMDELATLTSTETRKSIAQAALTMARLLDNPNAVGQWKGAASELRAIMSDLRQGSSKRAGRLASVQSMVKPKTGSDAATG